MPSAPELLRVPAIDIGSFLSGDPAGRRRVTAQVATACREIGFLVITNHGLPAGERYHVIAGPRLS